MKKALTTALFIGLTYITFSHSTENIPDITNRSLLSDSLKITLKPLKSKTFFEKSMLASKGIASGIVGALFLYNLAEGSDTKIKSFLNTKNNLVLRAGAVGLLIFSMLMTAEMTNYSLRSFQDLV